MSRSSAPVLTTLPLLLLLLGAAVLADDAHTTDTSCSVQSCAALDVAVLSSYVSGLNVSVHQWPTNDTTSNESAQQLPPFGALASDWSRLLLLQNRQPEGSLLRVNLLRLSRILLAAYFDAEDDGGAEWSSRPSDDGQAQQASGNNATAAGQKKKDISGDNEEATLTTTTANNNGEPKNLNRTFPTMDNEANGRSGNDSTTTLTRDNEDESGRAETSGAPGTTADDRFALTTATVPNEGKSSESSVANEAVHPRSKEDFLEAKYAEKEGDGDGRVARFFMSDESDSSVTSDELVNNFFAVEDNVAKANQSSVEETTDHMTKSLEDFFNGEDDHNSTSVDSGSFEFNSTKSIEDFFADAEEVGKITTTTDTEIDFNSQDSEEIISPSVEDFFAHEEDFANATTLEGNSTSGEVEGTKSTEVFFKSKETVDDQDKVTTNKSLLVNSTSSGGNVTNNEGMVPENLDVLSASNEGNETMIEQKHEVIHKLVLDESKKVNEDEKLNDTITSTTTFEEATTTATTAIENGTTSETIPASTTTESYPQKNVTSTSTDSLTTLVPNSLRIDNNLTTLAQLISGQLTTLLPATNSNEITSQVNGVVDLSTKNPNTTVTTSTSPPSENRTTVKTDDLSTTTERQTAADVPVTQVSSEVPVEEAAAVAVPLVRQARHIPTSSHVDDSSRVIVPAITSSHNSSVLKKSTLSQPSAPASPETRRRRRHNRPVRSTHKRAGAVLDDDDQQYRTFAEPRQTQFAEKRSRRGTQYEQQQRQH